MLRITPIDTDGRPELKLEGKISSLWVDEMKRYWLSVTEQRRRQLQINLREVSYVDRRGKDLLLQIEREGASLVGPSEFLMHVLHEEPSSRETTYTPKEQEETHHDSPIQS